MLFAAIEFTDFAVIAAVLAVLVGGSTAHRSLRLPVDRTRLGHVKRKLQLLLTHAGLGSTPPRAAWQALAEGGPGGKLATIKAYRDHDGTELGDKASSRELHRVAPSVLPYHSLQQTPGLNWFSALQSSPGSRHCWPEPLRALR